MGPLERNNVTVPGKGPVTIMFAPGFGCDKAMWRYVASAFEDQHKPYCLTTPVRANRASQPTAITNTATSAREPYGMPVFGGRTFKRARDIGSSRAVHSGPGSRSTQPACVYRRAREVAGKVAAGRQGMSIVSLVRANTMRMAGPIDNIMDLRAVDLEAACRWTCTRYCSSQCPACY
jgi:hypothetical protein